MSCLKIKIIKHPKKDITVKTNITTAVPFCDFFGSDLLTKTPATTQSELSADRRNVFTRLTGTGVLLDILSLSTRDDNRGLIMRRPNTGSAAGSKPNVGDPGASFVFGSLLATSASKSTTLDLIDSKKSPNAAAATSLLSPAAKHDYNADYN